MIIIYALNCFAKNQTAILFFHSSLHTRKRTSPMDRSSGFGAFVTRTWTLRSRQTARVSDSREGLINPLRKKSDLCSIMTTLCKSHKGRTPFLSHFIAQNPPQKTQNLAQCEKHFFLTNSHHRGKIGPPLLTSMHG